MTMSDIIDLHERVKRLEYIIEQLIAEPKNSDDTEPEVKQFEKKVVD